MTLRLYDSSGLLVYQAPFGQALPGLGPLTVSANPWDPSQAALTLTWSGGSGSYDGRDSSGSQLRNGVYLLVLEASDGSKVQLQLQVLGAGGGRVALTVGPNPVRPGQSAVLLRWSPVASVELKVFSLDGGLVRDFGLAAPPQWWDLRSQGGAWVSNGIYVVSARVVGERQPQFYKLMLAR